MIPETDQAYVPALQRLIAAPQELRDELAKVAAVLPRSPGLHRGPPQVA
jgi:hypothetical protein